MMVRPHDHTAVAMLYTSVFMISCFASHLITHTPFVYVVYLKVHIFIFTTFGPLAVRAALYSPFTQERSFLSFTFLYTGGVGGGTQHCL